MKQKLSVGARFGRWTVLEILAPRKTKKRVLVKCDCGTVKDLDYWSVRGKLSTGCVFCKDPDIFFPGARFCNLTLLELSRLDARNRQYFRCMCDCGKERIVQAHLLKYGVAVSCMWCSKHNVLGNKLRLPNDGGVVNQIRLSYKAGAKQRGLDYVLDKGFFDKIIRQPCIYCGTLGSNLKKTECCKSGFRYNGIDRLDPNIGYYEYNCAPCCGLCNRAKLTMTKEKFIEWIRTVYHHFVKHIKK